jgi:hypothetical protein
LPERPHNAPIDFDLTGDNAGAATSALSADTPVQQDAPTPRLREHPPTEHADDEAAGTRGAGDDGSGGDDADRWVAHRREGWTVEQPGQGEPVSTHDTFDEARTALTDRAGTSAAQERTDNGRQEANDNTSGTRTVEGWVVDIACLRKYPEDELASRARAHTAECALMGHCVESGYGLVDADGRIHLLDDQATPHVVTALRSSDSDSGIRLRAERHSNDGEMVTTSVAETSGS